MMNFIAFDLETTGTVPGVDTIVEIGAVKFVNGEPESMFVTLVDPMRPIPPGASRVNGITDDMVKGQSKIEHLLEPFADFCEDFAIVAHNAPFDSQFLTAEIKKYESRAPLGVILDTLPIARKVLPGLANYKLGTIVQHLKIPTGTFHRAEADAIYCGRLFLEMAKRVSVNGQPPAIENLISLTGRPESRFPQIVRAPKQLGLLDLF